MAKRLEGKVAVITGAGSGIGRATVLRFMEEGARVIVSDINADSGQETVALAKKQFGDGLAQFVKTDVSKEADVEAAIAAATRHFGRLDCVYNNAGFGGAIGPLTEISAEDWDFTIATLLRGVFFGLKHGARALKAQGQGGSLISTSSVAGLIGGVRAVPYATAKAGIIHLTKRAATSLAPFRIRINTVAPGHILTPLTHRGQPDAARPYLVKSQPWPDAGEPIDIANAALFLASDESRFITGTTILVDGGVAAVGSDRFNTAFDDFAHPHNNPAGGLDVGSTGIQK
jgi:NAD(P)-dependent dehydrogenase (short-subunit alcohol dehydrogenase family)